MHIHTPITSEVFLDIWKSSGGVETINFLRTIPDLQDFPIELLQTNPFSCSTHFYKRGAVIVKNSNDAEWIYVIRSGSCQAFKAVRPHDKLEDKPVSRNQSSLLPSISTASLDSVRKAKGSPRRSPSKAKSMKKRNSRTILPNISKAKNSMVSQSYDESTSSWSGSSRKSSNRTIDLYSSSENPSMYYAKVDLLTERECFGLQSLVFDNMPSLSLVSNGAECILISKQFLKDHMDKEIKRRLQSKIPPYPSLNQIKKAVNDKLSWEAYKDRILSDTMK